MPNTLVHTIEEGNQLNRDYIAVMLPLYLMAVFMYGPRAALLGVVAVAAAKLTDRLAATMRSRRYDKRENSSITIALLLVLMMPASVPVYVVVVSIVLAIFVAKDAFGGFMRWPFNPAAVGFCVAAVCWPQQVLNYPQPTKWLLRGGQQSFGALLQLWGFSDASLVEGPSMTLRNGGLPKIDFWSLLLGDYAGPMGAGCIVVLLACAVYLAVKRRLPLLTPLAFLGTAAVIAFVFPRYSEITFNTWPQDIMLRLQVVKFELLSGAMLFTAVLLVDEPSTLPQYHTSRLLYGVLLGVAAMMFRYFGTYELGSCFAIVLVNGISGYLDRAVGQVAALVRKRRGVAA